MCFLTWLVLATETHTVLYTRVSKYLVTGILSLKGIATSRLFNSLSSSVSIQQPCDLWHWRNISAIHRNIPKRNIHVVTTIWANTAAFTTVIYVQNVVNSFLISRASNQVTSQLFSSTYSRIRWSPLCCRRFGATAPACSAKKPANSYPLAVRTCGRWALGVRSLWWEHLKCASKRCFRRTTWQYHDNSRHAQMPNSVTD